MVGFDEYYRTDDNLSDSEKEYSFLTKVLIFKKRDMTKVNLISDIISDIKGDKSYNNDILEKDLIKLIKKKAKDRNIQEYIIEKIMIDAIFEQIKLKLLLENSGPIDVLENSILQSSNILNIDIMVRDKFIELLKSNEKGYSAFKDCLRSDKKCNTLRLTKLINDNYDKSGSKGIVQAPDIIDYYNKHKKLLQSRIIEDKLVIDGL